MSIKTVYANVEFDDGRTVEDVRVIFADRLSFERTAKARGWDAEAQPQTTAGFLAWAALKRRGDYPGSYDDFLAAVVDVQLDDERTPERAAEGDADPSRPAPTAGY